MTEKNTKAQPPLVQLIPIGGYFYNGKQVYIKGDIADGIKNPSSATARVYENRELADDLKRLQEYEALDLTPEQIRILDKLYREKCEELNRIKDGLEALARKVQHGYT